MEFGRCIPEFDPFIPSIFCYGGDIHYFDFDLAFRDLASYAKDIQRTPSL
jgi:hypothetical protein